MHRSTGALKADALPVGADPGRGGASTAMPRRHTALRLPAHMPDRPRTHRCLCRAGAQPPHRKEPQCELRLLLFPPLASLQQAAFR